MTSLYFGLLREGTPADEAVVRSTAPVYDQDAPPAVQDSAPDRGELPTDSNPRLGLVNRQRASQWVQSVKTAPFWRADADAAVQHNLIVDEQVATSGTAAAREAAGEFGHGTMGYAVGIEPVGDLTDGGKMGNEYFVRTPREIQETADDSMMSVPPGYDQSVKGRVAAQGKVNSRKAAVAGLYDTYWNGGQ